MHTDFFKVLLFAVFLLVSTTVISQVPHPNWVNDVGGNSSDSKTTGLQVDNDNNVYIAGYFRDNIDLDPSIGEKRFNSNGDADIYIAKYTTAGNLIWGIAMGGDALDLSNSMAVDKNGNITITGQFQSTVIDADPGPGVHNIYGSGGDDIFVIHLDKNGNLLWAKAIGGSGSERGQDVFADNNGNVIIGSIFSSPVTVSGQAFDTKGGYDGLLMKFGSDGNLIWAFTLGGTSDDQIRGVSIDGNDNIYISGSYSGMINYDPLGPGHNLDAGNGIFTARYRPDGHLVWVNSAKGNVVDYLSLVTVNKKGDVYLSGAFSGSLNFGGSNLNATGTQDIFIAKYNAEGNFVFSKDVGSSGSGFVYRFTSDADNNIYCAGYFSGQMDFNPDISTAGIISSIGQRDLYLAKYDENGNYKWAFGAGNASCSNTFGIEIAIDKNKNILLGGAFCSSVDFDPSKCNSLIINAKSYVSDSFVAQYTQYDLASSIPVISTFTLTQQVTPAIIDKANSTITVTVPAGTDITNLSPQITTSSGASVTPASGSVRNFAGPVNYVVTNNCESLTYTVIVKTQSLQPQATIVSSCPNEQSVFNGEIIASPADTYVWQVYKDGAWLPAAGNNSLFNYSFTTIQNISGAGIVQNYRRSVIKQGIASYDSFYELTITPSTARNIISLDKTEVCNASYEQFSFIGNQPDGFTQASTYNWQQSTDGTTWQNIVDVGTQTWGLSAKITTKTWFRRITTTGNCISYSNEVSIDNIVTTTANAGQNQRLCNVTQATLKGNMPALGETGTWTVVFPANYNPFDESNTHDPNAQINNLPLNTNVVLMWTILRPSCSAYTTATVSIDNNNASMITAFTVAEQNAPAVINHYNHTITLSVSPKADLTHLIPSITTNNGTLSPASGIAQNFTEPITYRITDVCGFTDYKVTITNATVSNLQACQSTTFNILIPGSTVAGTSFQWQIYQNGTWQNITSNANNSDFIASYSRAPTSVTFIESYRRVVVTSSNAIYDSYSDVFFEPTITNNQITANQSVCAASSNLVNIIGNVPEGGSGNITYQWRSSNDNVSWQNINNATQKNYQFTFNSTGNMYYLRVARSNSCEDVSNSVMISYIPEVTVAVAGNNQTGCGLNQLTLAANTPRSTEVGTWSVISPLGYNPFNASNMHNPKAIINKIPLDADIELKWVITEVNCTQVSESTVIVRNNSQPVVFGGTDVTIELGKSIVLHPQINALPGYTVKWVPSIGLNNDNVNEPAASPAETTTYRIMVTSVAGCEVFSDVTVFVKNDLVIPNTITPNGDAINDIWNIKNIYSYKDISVAIFNRWGQQVFYSKGYAKPWDGTHNGKKLPEGVYYYIILSDSNKLKKLGSVTILY
jgi:gliding motility-associated-like protein